MLFRVDTNRAAETSQQGPARRFTRIARVGARYGFGFVFGGRFALRRTTDAGGVGPRLRLSFEELGPTFAELGRFLSARGDLLPRDVATELGRALVPVKPLAPAEVRARVERELGNTLERLFLEFEEPPTRTGTFTQSHRAVLPGRRSALVVIARTGVRRDLLAMRPVAELTRRRLGGRLPLDPVQATTEFSAHVAHRRDMYSAAQNLRRLRNLDDLGVRAPDIYRDYSTDRCITFEAPPAASLEPLTTEQYRRASSALIRLALVEGLFLPDIVAERFAFSGGELWLADPTEMFALDDERLRGLAEILAAVRREDVDGVLRALPLAGSTVPQDTMGLRRELRETLGSLGGPLWREHRLVNVRGNSMEALRRGGAELRGEVALMFHSLVAAEELANGAEGGDEEYVGTVAAASASEALISRFRDPRRVAARAARSLAQPDTYADYPRQVHELLDELKDGEIEVQFRHEGLNDLISKVDILANRLVFALLIAALIVGSSMLGIFSQSGARLLGVSVFGLVGFVVAAILGLGLLIDIIRSGRL